MANSDNIKNDAALVDVSQIKAINKVSFKQRMKAYKRKPLSLVLLILVGLAAALSAAALIFIIAYVLVRGVPNLTPELFSLEYNSDQCIVYAVNYQHNCSYACNPYNFRTVRCGSGNLSCRVRKAWQPSLLR